MLFEPLGLIRLVHLPTIYFLLMHYCLLAEPLGWMRLAVMKEAVH